MRVVRLSIVVDGAEHWFDANDTKSSVIEKLGEPIAVGGGNSWKHKSANILMYSAANRIEFHFDHDRLFLIWQERDGIVELSVRFL